MYIYFTVDISHNGCRRANINTKTPKAHYKLASHYGTDAPIWMTGCPSGTKFHSQHMILKRDSYGVCASFRTFELVKTELSRTKYWNLTQWCQDKHFMVYLLFWYDNTVCKYLSQWYFIAKADHETLYTSQNHVNTSSLHLISATTDVSRTMYAPKL